MCIIHTSKQFCTSYLSTYAMTLESPVLLTLGECLASLIAFLIPLIDALGGHEGNPSRRF
jgi:hypothetical protein